MISTRKTGYEEEGAKEEKRSRGRSCKVCRGSIRRLHMRPLCSKLCCTPSNRLLTYGTHGIEEWRRRNSDVHVCEDVSDSRRADELIICSRVSIAIYNRFYHMWWKVYRKTLHKRKKETSTRLGDSVIVKPWSEYKGHHHIKDLLTLSKLSCGEIEGTSPQLGLLTEE